MLLQQHNVLVAQETPPRLSMREWARDMRSAACEQPRAAATVLVQPFESLAAMQGSLVQPLAKSDSVQPQVATPVMAG